MHTGSKISFPRFQNVLMGILWGLSICLCSTHSLTAQTRQELEKQKEQAQREISEAESLLSSTQKKQTSSIQSISLLTSKINKRNEVIQNIQQSIRLTDSSIATTEKEIESLRRNITSLKQKYAQLIRLAYKQKGKYTELLYVLAADDVNEAYLRFKYFRQLSTYRKSQVEAIEAEKLLLTASLDNLNVQKAEKAALLQEELQETALIEKEKNSQNKLLKQLKTKESQIKKDINTKKAAAKRLDQTIQKLIAEEIAKRNATSKSLYESLTPTELKLSSSFKENRGKLPWPCTRGVITGKFGTYAHPVYSNITLQNYGIDITTPSHAEIVSIFEGEVLYVAIIPGSNMAVVIQHGNYISLYQNLVDVLVKKGDHVGVKQPLGNIYTDTASATGTLHLEIWEDQTKLNPALWLSPK